MKSLAWALAALTTVSSAHAESLESLLQKFDSDPQTFMNTIPEKKGAKAAPFFSERDIRNKNYVSAKNQTRKLRGRSAIKGNDQPEDLVDNSRSMIRSLEEMAKRKTHQRKTSGATLVGSLLGTLFWPNRISLR